MKILKQNKHKKGPDLKKKLKFKKGKRTKGKLKEKKEKLTFKQRIRKLPNWIKKLLIIIITPIAIIADLLFKLIKFLPKILKPTLKYIGKNFISIITLVILIFTIYTSYILLKDINSKIDSVEEQINIDKETQSKELEEYNKNIEQRLNELQQKTEDQQKQTTELREKLNRVSVTSRGSTTPRQSSNTRTTNNVKVTGTKAEYQAYAKQLCNSYGWSENDFQCLVKLVDHESSWNPNAVNKSSGASGLFQALPASKMASEGSDYMTNYKTQIKWGLKYIKNRYGSPSNAWSFWQSHRWY